MAELESFFQHWKWVDTQLTEAEAEGWRLTYDSHQPFYAVVERGVICSKCGREAEVLFFDRDIDSEAEMREAARRLIGEARERTENDPENRCGNHIMIWTAGV